MNPTDDNLFDLPDSPATPLAMARARLAEAQTLFLAAQDAEDDCDLGIPMPHHVAEEYRAAQRALAAAEADELKKRI